MGPVVTMVLAARPGVGFTEPPWLHRWGDTTLIEHVLGEVRSWPVDPGLVVLGAGAEEILDTVDLSGFMVVVDPEWEEGEAAPLRAGVDVLMRENDVDSFVLTSADVPALPAPVVAELVAAHARGDRPLTIAKYRYARARPIVVRRELWPRLLGLEDDAGIEAVLDTHSSWVEEVWVDHLPPRVIGSPRDLEERSPRR